MTKFKTSSKVSKMTELLQTAKIVLAVTPAEKAALIQAAYPKTLAAYLRGIIGLKK